MAGNITLENIQECRLACGFTGHAPRQLCIELVNGLKSANYLSTRNRIAIFLAQVFHESGGLENCEEMNCNPVAHESYMYDGKCFHGRGILQISHHYNYRAAGHGQGLGDSFFDNPSLVLSAKNSVSCALWFWRTNIIKDPDWCSPVL
ncbi:unnamed protein product [Dimorphilus gyrociliatus]|uniref:Glycoside hydrolase family 19 catalytic domain-containing protein n=1 Tax=Dimorphilus gyrociliatus TaxID=2664684 RepID=A0A7I8W9N6_9ANNE|nr:unnamed protein product [Dimorphilus gyrociliatus]